MITQTQVLTANPEMVELFFKRAKEGAEALRAKFGRTWYKKIDVSALSMSSCKSCVLGQAFQDYSVGVRQMMGHPVAKNGALAMDEHLWAVRRGFVLFDNDTSEHIRQLDTEFCAASWSDLNYAYGVLGDVWREVIKAERRKVRK